VGDSLKDPYIVWKLSEVLEIANPAELEVLSRIVNRMVHNREQREEPKHRTYIVVEGDKPYATEIQAIIDREEKGE
jgi:hypothetical protein